MQFGAKGYLLKDTPLEEIADAIRAAVKGYTSFGPGLFQKFIAQSDSRQSSISPELPLALKSLSPREKEVLSLITKGANNKEIAEQLYISERTVKAHITSILGQFSLRDRTQVAIIATQYGLV